MNILIVIPAYNEEKIIEANLNKLVVFCRANLPNDNFKIILADNASIDRTAAIVKALAQDLAELEYFYLAKKGKGLAIRTVWQKEQDNFDIFIFMDADLATDLQSLPVLVAQIKNNFDLAIGSRYLPESQVERTLGRKIFSFVYRLVLKSLLGTKINDFPCGFKAVNQRVVRQILPQIINQTWFFDSELVYLAEINDFKIKEIPVKWQEPRSKDDQSKVDLASVSWLYLKELWRLKFRKK